jgi:hypothetical protein
MIFSACEVTGGKQMTKQFSLGLCALLLLTACTSLPTLAPTMLAPTMVAPTAVTLAAPATHTSVPLPTRTAQATSRPTATASPVQEPTATAVPTDVPTAEPTVTPPLAYTDCDPTHVSPFGVTMYENVSDALGLAHMQAAGSRRVTTFLRWYYIEPSPPVNGQPGRNWTTFDIQVQNAQAAGMEVFALVSENPPWAAALPGGPVTNTLDLINFMTAAVERYDGDGLDDAPGSPVITYWSLYAEPDNETEWYARLGKGYWGNNVAGFAELLTQLTPALHAANPRAKVLMGGLAYDNFTTEGGPFNPNFLPSLLEALNAYPGGATAYLDAMAFHFYPVSAQRWPTIRDKAQAIRGILEQHGAGSLPLLVPEMGYWSDPAVGSNENWQAEYLVQMYTTGLAAGIEQLSWFDVFDNGPGSEMHGLFRNRDLSAPKPAYTAYATMTSELAGGRYLRELSAPGVSGFVFSTCDAPEKLVVWGHTANGSVNLAQGCVRRVSLLGEAAQVVDGAADDLDGVANGQVTVRVTDDDLFYLGQCL